MKIKLFSVLTVNNACRMIQIFPPGKPCFTGCAGGAWSFLTLVTTFLTSAPSRRRSGHKHFTRIYVVKAFAVSLLHNIARYRGQSSLRLLLLPLQFRCLTCPFRAMSMQARPVFLFHLSPQSLFALLH